MHCKSFSAVPADSWQFYYKTGTDYLGPLCVAEPWSDLRSSAEYEVAAGEGTFNTSVPVEDELNLRGRRAREYYGTGH